jgi:hypothetical protein
MCKNLNCFVKKGYYYCKETGKRCEDGIFDKRVWKAFDGEPQLDWKGIKFEKIEIPLIGVSKVVITQGGKE